MEGHTVTVMDIAWCDHTQQLFTGSMDKSIREWKGTQAVRVLQGHTDWVRALALNETAEALL